ncbi:zinc-binding dehydrogenase [Glycomyces halotolerans]
MRAVRQHEFGGPEVLRIEETPEPEPGPGQVRIRVHAAGVHLIDTTIRAGRADRMPYPLPELPMIPGREAAGVVDAAGPGVDPAWIGERVVAHLGFASGGYAEWCVRDLASVHALPDGAEFAAAVAMIGTGRTALMVLETGPVTAEDTVIVPAAAGGIGTLLTQAAKNAGAHVVGLAGGPDKAARVRAGDADAAIDYRTDDWTRRLDEALDGREATLVYDSVGGGVGRAMLERLGFGGRLVIFGWSSGEATELSAGDIVEGGLTVSSALGPKLLERMGGLREVEARALAELAAGRLVPAVQRFALAEAEKAHRALEDRDTVGKVVLVP